MAFVFKSSQKMTLKLDFSAKPSACELRVAQYEKPLTKGHCPKHKTDPDRKDPEKVAKKRSERKERSHVLKEKIVKLIESGLQLSEYQARKVLLMSRNHLNFSSSHTFITGIFGLFALYPPTSK